MRNIRVSTNSPARPTKTFPVGTFVATSGAPRGAPVVAAAHPRRVRDGGAHAARPVGRARCDRSSRRVFSIAAARLGASRDWAPLLRSGASSPPPTTRARAAGRPPRRVGVRARARARGRGVLRVGVVARVRPPPRGVPRAPRVPPRASIATPPPRLRGRRPRFSVESRSFIVVVVVVVVAPLLALPRGGDVRLPLFPSTPALFAQSVGIGATVAFGGLVFAISFATLVFSGPDAPEGALAAGTGFVLWSGLVGASGVALRSSLPAIAEVQDGPSAIFAIMAAAIFGAEGVDDAAKLPTLEAAILATTTASGALMMALGRAKLGNIVRLLPSPVTGGFLAGTGWVLSTGAFKVLTGLAFSVDNVVVAAKSPELFTVVAPGVALGAALAVGNRKIGAFWVVPAFLGGGVAAYFAGLDVALGLTPDDALAAGYLLGPFATDAVSGSFQPLLFSPETLAKVRWDVVLDQGPRAATVFGLSTLGLLLITSAVEVSTEREGDANEELKAVGLANVVSGLGGGLVSYHSLSSTQIAHGMGSSSRLPGLVAAAVYAAALVVGPAPLAYVPRALIGGLLTFIGASFLYEWIVEGRENLPRSEFAVVLLIVVTVASQGYLAGVVAGVLGAAAVFVSDYSRVPIVRSRLRVGGRGGIRSSAPRSRADVDVLIERGAGVYGAKLQGFLFFATAYTLLEEIKTEHARLSAESNGERPMTHVLLDFASVVGVDGSAISVFEKLRRFAARENVALVLSDVDRRELARVVTITLYGEDRPTFAFVDRADPNTVGLQDGFARAVAGRIGTREVGRRARVGRHRKVRQDARSRRRAQVRGGVAHRRGTGRRPGRPSRRTHRGLDRRADGGGRGGRVGRRGRGRFRTDGARRVRDARGRDCVSPRVGTRGVSGGGGGVRSRRGGGSNLLDRNRGGQGGPREGEDV